MDHYFGHVRKGSMVRCCVSRDLNEVSDELLEGTSHT